MQTSFVDYVVSILNQEPYHSGSDRMELPSAQLALVNIYSFFFFHLVSYFIIGLITILPSQFYLWFVIRYGGGFVAEWLTAPPPNSSSDFFKGAWVRES